MNNETLLEEFLSLVEVERYQEHFCQDISNGKYFDFPLASIVTAEKRLRQEHEKGIAYFSMEYGLGPSFYNTFSSQIKLDRHNTIPPNTIFSNYRLADYFFDVNIDGLIDLPIYSGGLGVLAGDTVKTMADYKLPVVAVGILWHSGYFKQRFWYKHGQVPEKMHWHPHSYPGLIPLKNIVTIKLRDELIHLKLWKYYVYSYRRDYVIPLILLDAEIPQNNKKMKDLTDQLYRSDNAWIKIMQRIVLGYGGIAALKELGYCIDKYHLNEGHAIFSFVAKAKGLSETAMEKLKSKFYYTCHTPVEAGHDRFSNDDLSAVLDQEDFSLVKRFGKEKSGLINLTLLAMNTSAAINAVSKSHQRVMKAQFPEYKERIQYVTNGVHPYTWISAEFLKIFKEFPSYFEDIEGNPMVLSRAKDLKGSMEFRRKVWVAHQANKKTLCDVLEKWKLSPEVFTCCWARRIAAYKRPSLLLYEIEKVVDIAKRCGPLQIILAGKAHPNDNMGFTFINEMMDKVDSLSKEYDFLKIVILENYDMFLGKFLTCGVDVWLNNPLPPFEASGTSGMKAILNGVVQLSTLDGWVVEAEDKNVGVIFGYKNSGEKIGNELDLHMQDDSVALYGALEEMMKKYNATHNDGSVDLSSPWIDMMIDCIAAGAYFNTYRMLDEYKHAIWKVS